MYFGGLLLRKIFREASIILLIIFAALCIRTIAYESYFVPTGSMVHTILPGDYIIATKYDYGISNYSIPFQPNLFHGKIFNTHTPERGDIVVLYLPNTKLVRFVKRVIGLPGDKIQMKRGLLHINDKPVKKEFIKFWVDEEGTEYAQYLETLPNGIQHTTLDLAGEAGRALLDSPNRNTEATLLAENQYFCMGDNRDNSGDSRCHLPPIFNENIIGKARFIWLSTKELLFPQYPLSFIEHIKQIGVWLKSIRTERAFMSFTNKSIQQRQEIDPIKQ